MLEIVNIIIMKAKRSSITSFIGSAVVVALLVYWAYQSEKPFDLTAYVIFGACILIVGLGLYFKIGNLKNVKAGLEPTDELSKRIKEKAAAKAFEVSIFMWVLGVLFFADIDPASKVMIGLGVMGMGLVFLITWLYYSKVGISDED